MDINTFHKIDGKWYHISQVTDFEKLKRSYYTDGKLEAEYDINPDGTVKK